LATPIEVLASLQSVDQRLRAKTLELTDSERRVAALEGAVREQTAAANVARELLAGLATRQQGLETRLAAAESKMRDRRMRITRIRNDKELGLAKREIELLKEEASGVETELLEVMQLVEGESTKLRDFEAELARLTQERNGEAATLREALARLTGEIERERAERTVLIDRVDDDLRRKYEQIFSRRGGLAVVEVRGGICLGCRMRVPPQLFNDIQRAAQVILCPSCQRILYWRAEAEEANG